VEAEVGGHCKIAVATIAKFVDEQIQFHHVIMRHFITITFSV